jgi:hypothetical protein
MARVFGLAKSAAFVVATMIGGAAVPATAQVTVNFTASGDSEEVALDNGTTATVTLSPNNAGSIVLTPGVAELVDLNDASFDFIALNASEGLDTLSQTLTITSPSATPASRTISQSLRVDTQPGFFDPANGSAFIGLGSAVTFDLGASGILTVTPLPSSTVNQVFSPASFTNRAEFELTAPVPEPAALSLLAGGVVFALRRRRVN